MKLKQCALIVLCVCLAQLTGCGSAHIGNTVPVLIPSPTPHQNNPTGAVSVAVSPGTATVFQGKTQQFTALVGNTSNTNVTWQVAGIAGGNETVGTITITGLYTAPAIAPTGPLAITAISSADNETFGEAMVYVDGLAGSHFAYVSSASDDSIQVFVVDPASGTPAPKSTLLLGAGKGPTTLAIHPTVKFLYSLNRGSNEISIFGIDQESGELTAIGSASTPDGPYALVFSPKGDFAYVTCDNASAVAEYAVSASTGALTPLGGSPYSVGGRAQGLAISPDGRFLYVADHDTNQIFGLGINQNDGSLGAMNGSPFSAADGLSSIVVDVAYAYTASADSVGIYQRDPLSGSLTFVGSTSTGGSTPELFRDLSTGFLLGVNSSGGGFFSFELDGDTLYSYGPPVSSGNLPAPGGMLSNPDNYPWAYILNRTSGTSSTTGSIGVYIVAYDGTHGPRATVPVALNNPTGFAITP